MFGYFELIVIGLVGLLLFGKRVPSVMRSVGEAVSQFRRGLGD